ncbi:hypothetical protein GCM10010452_17310 [Crossiella cryophila]
MGCAAFVVVAPPLIHADVRTFTAGRLAGYRSWATHLHGPQAVAVHAEPSRESLGPAVAGPERSESPCPGCGAEALVFSLAPTLEWEISCPRPAGG